MDAPYSWTPPGQLERAYESVGVLLSHEPDVAEESCLGQLPPGVADEGVGQEHAVALAERGEALERQAADDDKRDNFEGESWEPTQRR